MVGTVVGCEEYCKDFRDSLPIDVDAKLCCRQRKTVMVRFGSLLKDDDDDDGGPQNLRFLPTSHKRPA